MLELDAGHLGGFIPGGDEATWYPALWQWLVRELEIETVLDVGCGDGVALDYFVINLERQGVGVDGVTQSDPFIVEHDYTTGPLDFSSASGGVHDLLKDIGGEFDLCWCCEFVEHVEERYMPNYLETFKLARFVLLTHAEPGQQGHHHVHCQTSDYWKGALAAIGFGFDPALTAHTRELAAFNTSPWNHYTRSGMVFLRL